MFWLEYPFDEYVSNARLLLPTIKFKVAIFEDILGKPFLVVM